MTPQRTFKFQTRLSIILSNTQSLTKDQNKQELNNPNSNNWPLDMRLTTHNNT